MKKDFPTQKSHYPAWKLDRFGRSLIDCLAAIQQLKSAGVRFIAITQGIDTDESNPAARFQLQVLAAAAEFERELIRERTLAGSLRYRKDYDAGKIGKERSSRSGKNLAIGRPKKIFDREQVTKLRSEGLSLRQIAPTLGTVRLVAFQNVLARKWKRHHDPELFERSEFDVPEGLGFGTNERTHPFCFQEIPYYNESLVTISF